MKIRNHGAKLDHGQIVTIQLEDGEIDALQRICEEIEVLWSCSHKNRDQLLAQVAGGICNLLEQVMPPKHVLQQDARRLYPTVAGLWRQHIINEPPAIVTGYDNLRDASTPDDINGEPLPYKESPYDGIGTRAQD